MNRAQPKKYIFDRRSFAKGFGLLGVSTFLLSPKTLMAAEEEDACFQEKPSPEDSDYLQFWIDGLHLSDYSDIASRANIALFVEILQTEEEHVEAVILTDQGGQVIGAQYYDHTQKMSSGHVPHVIFQNIALDHTKDYYVYYQLRSGSNVKLYQYTIAKPKRTNLFKSFLPSSMRVDFQASQGATNEGLISSPFQFYTQNGLTLHCARASVIDIGTNGDFRIDVALMHGDGGDDHYMRYFIIADPVGRILGFVKRKRPSEGGTPTDTTVKGGAGMIVNQLSQEQIDEHGILPKYVAKIQDCPYVQVFTEDVFDALARSVVRLR